MALSVVAATWQVLPVLSLRTLWRTLTGSVLNLLRNLLDHALEGRCTFEDIQQTADHGRALRVHVGIDKEGAPALLVPAFPTLHLKSVEVQERGLLKHARIAESIKAALRERGADELTARLGAELGLLAFSIAVERWLGSHEPFPLHALAALSDLRERAAGLGILTVESRPGHGARVEVTVHPQELRDV